MTDATEARLAPAGCQPASDAGAAHYGLGHPCRSVADASPDVVIDGQGREVAVLVGYAQYISLLGILATQLDSHLLPPYWRAAVDGCLCFGGATVARTRDAYLGVGCAGGTAPESWAT